MKKQGKAEKPKPTPMRFYKKHRAIIKKWKTKLQVSGAEVNRKALEFFDKNFKPF